MLQSMTPVNNSNFTSPKFTSAGKLPKVPPVLKDDEQQIPNKSRSNLVLSREVCRCWHQFEYLKEKGFTTTSYLTFQPNNACSQNSGKKKRKFKEEPRWCKVQMTPFKTSIKN